nr:MAG TPA: hypothetical protein [Caudoviricetes sp.]
MRFLWLLYSRFAYLSICFNIFFFILHTFYIDKSVFCVYNECQEGGSENGI